MLNWCKGAFFYPNLNQQWILNISLNNCPFRSLKTIVFASLWSFIRDITYNINTGLFYIHISLVNFFTLCYSYLKVEFSDILHIEDVKPLSYVTNILNFYLPLYVFSKIFLWDKIYPTILYSSCIWYNTDMGDFIKIIFWGGSNFFF